MLPLNPSRTLRFDSDVIAARERVQREKQAKLISRSEFGSLAVSRARFARVRLAEADLDCLVNLETGELFADANDLRIPGCVIA